MVFIGYWLRPAGLGSGGDDLRGNSMSGELANDNRMGLWSMLPQFNYTKLIIVVDPDIDVRNWQDIAWAMSTRFDAGRDLLLIEDTPIDYLDFASPKSGLGAKMGCDATNKIGSETDREWGRPLSMSAEASARADEIWERIKHACGHGRP